MDTPIPSYVSFPLSGVEGSLTGETLNWKNLSKKLGTARPCNTVRRLQGRQAPLQRDVHRRSGPGGAPPSDTVTGTQKCS